MPVEFVVDKKTRLVASRAYGMLDYKGILAHLTGLKNHPDFQSDFYQLFDCTEITGANVATAEIATLAHLNPFGKGARRAIVVSSELQFGLARMYQARADESGNVIRVFYSRSEAEEWLRNA